MEKSTESPHGCSIQYSPSKTTTGLASGSEMAQWVEAEGGELSIALTSRSLTFTHACCTHLPYCYTQQNKMKILLGVMAHFISPSTWEQKQAGS